MMAVTGALLACWWAAATDRYLRIRHAWAVALFVVLFAHLLQRLILATIDLILALR
jgi:multisubunit Na+/H+ antiporter MnhE subunit